MNNFEKMLEEGVLGDIGGAIKDKVVDKTIGSVNSSPTRSAYIAAQKRRKAAADKKIQAHNDKKSADDAEERAKNLKEVRITHKELQTLGSSGAESKADGSNISRFGKNYMIGYYKKRIEDAKKTGDKFATRLAKDALKGVERRYAKNPPTIVDTPEGS